VKKLIPLLALCLTLFVPLRGHGGLTAKSQTASDKGRNYQVLGADLKRIAIVNAKGEVEWEVPNQAREVHDIQMLPNGNVLFQTSYTTVVEMNRDKQIVWKHESKPKAGYTGAVEIHSYQRLKDGLTLIAETGNMRLIEVDKNDQIVHEVPLTVENPNSHRDTHMVRKLDNGHYLVCHEGDGKLREYDGGKSCMDHVMDLNSLLAPRATMARHRAVRRIYAKRKHDDWRQRQIESSVT
jgi:hypothetical protein